MQGSLWAILTIVPLIVCVLCLLGMPLLSDTDVRILPSTDSHSDLASDDNSSPWRVHTAVQRKPSETYAPGEACHRTPLLQPSDDCEAEPLQRHSDADECRC